MKYHKINTVYKRDSYTNKIVEGAFSTKEFEYLANNKWEFTEKVDGMNIRIYFSNGKITIRGRTDNAQIPVPLFRRIHERLNDQSMEGKLVDNAVLYGEGYGPGIQKGGRYRDDQDFVLFDIMINDWWLNREIVEGIGDSLGLQVVPVIGEGTLYDAVDLARKGLKSSWGDFEAEGLVMRPKVELQSRGGDRIISKIKCRDFAK